MENLSIKQLVPYKVVSHKAWEIVNIEPVLKLDWNEATISPSPLVIERIAETLRSSSLNWYPDVNNLTLLKKISEYANVNLENVDYYGSSDAIHEYLVRTYLNENSKLLLVSPTYDHFRVMAESVGAEIIKFNINGSSNRVDLVNLKNEICFCSPKMIYICNPNNPTGSTLNKDELIELIKEFPEVLFVVDEAYFEFTQITVADIVSNSENLIVTRTFSKAFALASFRIGYLIAHQKIIQTMRKIKNPKNISLFSQVAAIAALDDVNYMQTYVNEVVANKENFVFEIQCIMQDFKNTRIEYQVGGGNFILLKFDLKVKEGILNYFEGYKVFLRDLKHIPELSDSIRISIGTKSQMEFVIRLLRNFFEGM